jgi:hypothetical protein
MLAGTEAISQPPLRPRQPRWQQPPWTEASPEWQLIDRELDSDHPARQIRAAVTQFDLTGLMNSYLGVGRRAFPPHLLLMLVLLELHEGRTSPAQWYHDCADRGSVKFLLFGLRPSRSCLYAFRRRLGPHLHECNRLVLADAQAQGHTTASAAALDGTFVAALGSRHHLLNQETLTKRLEVLQAALAADAAATGKEPGAPAPLSEAPAPAAAAAPAVLPGAAAADGVAQAGMQSPAPAAAPGWLPQTPAGRRRQYHRYRQAEARLKERLEHHQRTQARQRKRCRRDAERVRVCAREPEAALGRDKLKTFRTLYNVQIARDVDTEFVLGYGVFATVTDAGMLPAMLERTAALTGQLPHQTLVDGIYVGDWDLGWCAAHGVDVYAPVPEDDPATAAKGLLPKRAFTWLPQEHTYRCPEGHELSRVATLHESREGGREIVVEQFRCPPEHCQACPRAAACTRSPQRGRTIKRSEYEEQREALARRMQAAEGRALYKLRSQTVEPCFGDFKEHRGLTRIRGFGLTMAWVQVGLLVLLHNALALWRKRSAGASGGRRALPLCIEAQASLPQTSTGARPHSPGAPSPPGAAPLFAGST